MLNKKNIKKYIKTYKKLIKSGSFHGAAGYSESADGSLTDLEVAARFLSMRGYPVSVDTETINEKRKCYVAIVD